MKRLCVTLLVLLFAVGSVQGAANFLEDFEGPPTAGTLEDDLGWTRHGPSAVGYGPATNLGTSAINDFKGNTYNVKPVPGLVDDVIVFKADIFQSFEEYCFRADEILNRVRSIKPAHGFDKVMVPGDKETDTKDKRKKEGIPIPDDTWQSIIEVAKSLGINDIDKI